MQWRIKFSVHVFTYARLVHCSCKYRSVCPVYLYRCQAKASFCSTSHVKDETYRLVVHDYGTTFHQTKYEWHVATGQICNDSNHRQPQHLRCSMNNGWQEHGHKIPCRKALVLDEVEWFAASVPNTHFMGPSTILHMLYVWSLLPSFKYCQGLSSAKH
jgi:hypothetical protein